MPHPAGLVAVGLDQPQVHVAFAILDHGVPLDVHAPHPGLVGWPYTIAAIDALQPCNSVCHHYSRNHTLALHARSSDPPRWRRNHATTVENSTPTTTSPPRGPRLDRALDQALRSTGAENGASSRPPK